MYTRPLVPGDGGALWEELMGFIGEPDATPTDEEPAAYRVGTVNADDTYTPRDRDDIVEEHYERELEEFRKEAESPTCRNGTPASVTLYPPVTRVCVH